MLEVAGEVDVRFSKKRVEASFAFTLFFCSCYSVFPVTSVVTSINRKARMPGGD